MRPGQKAKGLLTMIKQAIFTAAHHLTRETIQPGDDYRATFSAALKIARENLKAAMAVASDRAEKYSQREGRVYQGGGRWGWGLVNEGVFKTAADYAAPALVSLMDAIADEARAARAAEQQQKKASVTHIATARAKRTGERYVTSLAIAERDGLNHGRAWACGEMDIIRKGALPEWEGEMICYVYS
ncbi:hypothetical protein GY26_16115 [Gammaproteobacteria bacterium MFB021]|nr:hypothetical protein GY26_16115 [Gammaproteobacteria bacterium MFB021]